MCPCCCLYHTYTTTTMHTTTSTGPHSQYGADTDAASEVAPSEYTVGGRVGSRMSMRHEGGYAYGGGGGGSIMGWGDGPGGGGDDSSSQKGGATLKGMFKKQKKSKQIELDALRCEQQWWECRVGWEVCCGVV